MTHIPHHPRESNRIRALHVGVLDTPPEERFERLARLARALFDVPTALVSLLDADRHRIKTHQGREAADAPPEWTVCAEAILQDGSLVVADTHLDDRFKAGPLGNGEGVVRFFAGTQIRAPGGFPIGTLSIIDDKPRGSSGHEEELLSDLAYLVEREFAALRLATTDELTGLTNRRGFHLLAGHSLALGQRVGNAATLLLFDLDDFKKINDSAGHAAGDAALASFAAELLANFRDSDVVARLGGDEFCVLMSGAAVKDSQGTLAKLAARVARRNQGRVDENRIRYSVGVVTFDPELHTTLSDLVEAADTAMYEAKRSRD